MAPAAGMIGVVEKPIMAGGGAMPEPIVSFDERATKEELRELVRQTAGDILNGLLEDEAGYLVGDERHGRTAERESYYTDLYYRFDGASSLIAIYADSTWALPSSGTIGSQCFYNCRNLVGGNGTTWSNSNVGLQISASMRRERRDI